MQASALFLRWGSYRWAHNLWGLFIFIFPPSYVALCASSARHRLGSERVSGCLETSLFLRLPSWTELHPYLFCLFFCLLYFFLSSFEDNVLFFWVPLVLTEKFD